MELLDWECKLNSDSAFGRLFSVAATAAGQHFLYHYSAIQAAHLSTFLYLVGTYSTVCHNVNLLIFNVAICPVDVFSFWRRIQTVRPVGMS